MPEERNEQALPANAIHLSGKEKRQLRRIGHHLRPVVLVGREGITQAVLDSVTKALAAHELIKVKFGQNCPLAKKEAAEILVRGSGAALVQLIGKTVLLYLPNPDLSEDRKIHLGSS